MPQNSKEAALMPLKVRNSMSNMTVFAKPEHNLRLTWGPKGSHNDTQRVPDYLVDDIDFLNSLEQGIFEVLDAPDEIREKLQFESEQAKADRAEAEQRAMASIDRRQDRDIVSQTCIGPGPEGRTAACGRTVLMRNSEKSEVPPLCDQHKDLAPTFYLVEAGSKGEGATESRDGVVRREWKQAVVERT